MSEAQFDVVLGSDNEQIVQLMLDDVAQSVTPLQNMAVVFPDGIEIKSSEEPDLFDWATRSGEDMVVLTLGLTTGRINTGNHYPVKLFIFDISRPNGLLWDSVRMHVSQGTVA